MKYPERWAAESEDNDDIFEPSSKVKRAASSKGKSSAPPIVDSDDDFEPSTKAMKAASSKGKGKGVLRS